MRQAGAAFDVGLVMMMMMMMMNSYVVSASVSTFVVPLRTVSTPSPPICSSR
jgi:hypothetical protein